MDLRSALALEADTRVTFRPPADRRDSRAYAAQDKTRDGTFVRIRGVRPDDREHLATLTTEELAAEISVDSDEHVSVVATVWIEGRERIVGMASLSVDPWSEPRRAEVALTVRDAWQGRGIGTLLFMHLLRVAPKHHIDQIQVRARASNPRLLRVFGECGLAWEIQGEGSELRVSLRL
jgi:GNAT superfamily N-acetyltransferase